MNNLDLKTAMLRSYFESVKINPEDISPNLVASVCHDYFPFWEVTGEEVVELSNSIV
jgi:hypothetical protein